ncbi:MAG: hypothetical protein QNJ30_03285 [Kiloniellales bacterium]|nr:hypothetical protein [Kiloniellales bacterium]
MPASGLEISDSAACRGYFGKFSEITRHIRGLASEMSLDGRSKGLAEIEAEVLEGYLRSLSGSLTALSIKYLMTGLVGGRRPGPLTIDHTDSGFPQFQEIVRMAGDRGEAQSRLAELPQRAALKAEMVDHLLQHRSLPRDLQLDMSRRVYYEMLSEVPLFLAQNPPQLMPLGTRDPETRGHLCHWAVYDTQRNLPNVYLMQLEDSGERSLTQDQRRWPLVAEHLLAQSLSSLKLLTIARGFDKDFQDMHPKVLKRFHLGPMYANRLTRHSDTVQDILAESDDEPGQDWVLCWTVETLRAKGSKKTSTGLFGSVRTEIYDIDPQAPEEVEAGASAIERCMILPYRPYQRLVERDLPQLRSVRKYVVGPDGTILRRA